MTAVPEKVYWINEAAREIREGQVACRCGTQIVATAKYGVEVVSEAATFPSRTAALRSLVEQLARGIAIRQKQLWDATVELAEMADVILPTA